jgi:hypothetical protein
MDEAKVAFLAEYERWKMADNAGLESPERSPEFHSV